ncbi:MAG: DUF177 domain-containing protein [Oscillospiraceae bacterium]|nr:DUF177 domain-containing protein [Oscillospiraceae bacterium]
MRLDIKRILNVPGTKLDLDFCIAQEVLDEVRSVTFASPVHVAGTVENHAGLVTLGMQITFSLAVTCDRCLKETVQDFSYEETHTIVRRLESEDEAEGYIIARSDCIDPEETALTDLLLELPSKMLCREDCKGLCPVCGCDRNETDCGHVI